jgi:signal transduction histidine kinase
VSREGGPDGRPPGAELDALHVREREARESVERAQTELESFVFTVSHDLMTPLVSVSGYAELLNRQFGEILGDKGQLYVERILHNARFMQALLKDLLELSRVGRIQTEAEDVELQPLIAEIADGIRVSHPEASIHVGDLPLLTINGVRAQELFTNLVDNACRHGGHPSISVDIGCERLPGGAARLWVADDGRGIPAADRERVFAAFERLDPAESTAGSGMGLAVCRKIVESSGGRIWAADSEVGARIEMEFPAELVRSG